MTEEILMRVEPSVAVNLEKLALQAAAQLRIDRKRIKGVKVTKRSIDARQRRVMLNVGLRVFLDEMPANDRLCDHIDYRPLSPDAPQAIVVGAGPAGLFAALRLIELGVKPVVLERGKDVDSRRKDMAAISREGTVDPDSNYCFGEGGAGAYSDGKLYTRSKKRGSVEKILAVFYQHGANEDILIDAHPHIGTDKLPEVIKSLRQTIIGCGGEVHFGERVIDITINDDNVATGVVTAEGKNYQGPVILATGHSARDIYHLLVAKGVDVEPKGIAVGVRLEHPQRLIDQIQYHSPQGRGNFLPPAEYSLLTRVKDRGVYSFCMCPGGYIIPAASAPGQLVVNGMSPSNRGTRWANSGMVVEILPEDLPEYNEHGALKMMYFQDEIERGFFEDSHSQNAPAQRMADFVAGRESVDLPPTSYAPGIHPARIDSLLPDFVSKRLQAGFRDFGRKARGFLTNEAVLIGCETRTSSPVRVLRHPDRLEHVSIHGLFPCGEGAGYAGGIVSAAIDGERCADAVAQYLGV